MRVARVAPSQAPRMLPLSRLTAPNQCEDKVDPDKGRPMLNFMKKSAIRLSPFVLYTDHVYGRAIPQ